MIGVRCSAPPSWRAWWRCSPVEGSWRARSPCRRGLFREAARAAETAIADEDSCVAYADQWDDLVKVAFCAYPLLLLLAVVLIAWLLTAQTVTVAYARERAAGAALTLHALWRRSRPHLGAAVRVQSLTLACALVPALAGLLVLAAIQSEMVPGVV